MSQNRGSGPRKPSPEDRNADWILGTSWDAVRDELENQQRTGGPRRNPTGERPKGKGTGRPAKGRANPGAAKPGPTVKTARGGNARTPAKPVAKTTQLNWKTIRKQVLALLVFLGFLGAVWYGYQEITDAKAQLDATQAANNEKPDEVPICQPGDLEITFTSNATTLQAGSAWIGTINLKNKGLRACYTEGDGDRQGFKIKSGDTEVYNSLACAETDSAIPLLLGVGKAWETTITWDGKIWSDCKAGSVAKPGTYVATLFQKDAAISQPAVLTVVEPPPAKPEEKPADKPA